MRALRWMAGLLPAAAVLGCSCRPLTECEIAERPVIFLGKVVSGGVPLRDDPWQKISKSVRFEVVEVFRGVAARTKFVDVETKLWPGMCSPNPYTPGETYLVMPNATAGVLTDGICFTGRKVKFAQDVIEYLRIRFKGKSPSQIRGLVVATPFAWVSRHDQDQGEAKPLQHAKVWTVTGDKTLSTTADAHGRFELEVPGPGQYEVHAQFAPYPSAQASVDVTANGRCKVHDFGLQSQSTISGQVRNNQGELMSHAEVGLISLDNAKSGAPTRPPYPRAQQGPRDGRFLFKNVPLGRYLLVFNPDGAQADSPRAVPHEARFHPNASTQTAAAVVEVSAPHQHLTGKDVIAGPPVAFREVIVKARFADGTPMTTAIVTITGEPLEDGGSTWYRWKYVSKELGAVRFEVPTNRKFRTSVSDAYGRDLTRAYEATHSPGSAPIMQEFVVEP